MDYKKVYDNIISRALNSNRSKKDGSYYESHHIIPKCIGGTNDRSNLVLLTAKEHFIVHKLLVEVHPENKKLFFSYFMLSHDKRNGRDYIVSPREYKRLSETNSILAREKFKGENNPMFGSSRKGEENPFFGKHHTETSKEIAKNKRRERYERDGSPLKGIPKPEEHKRKMRECHADVSGDKNPNFGKKKKKESIEKGKKSFRENYKKENHPCFNKSKSEETRERIRNTLKNKYPKGTHPNTGVKKTEIGRINNSIAQKNRMKLTCPHCNVTMDICNAKRYHFDNCRTLIKIKSNEC